MSWRKLNAFEAVIVEGVDPSYGSMNGAPFSSKGFVVPRPSLSSVPSICTVAGKTMHVSAVGIFGAWDDPRQASFVQPHFAAPALHLDHLKLAADAEMFVEHLGQFTNSHAHDASAARIARRTI